MKQNKRGILMFISMILLIGLMFSAQIVKAADGDINSAGGIVLKDVNSNGKIDEVQITVDYAAGVASAISHAVDETATIGKFTVTDAASNNPVTVSSILFVSGDGAVAVFKLVLDESDADLNANTSGTALDIVYDAANFDLKITDGDSPVSVAAIASDVAEKDGAQPIILTAEDQNGTSLDGGANIPADANIIITFSEPMDTASLSANDEWSISPDPGSWSMPLWDASGQSVTFEKVGNFVSGATETVTLSAPLATGGETDENKMLQNTPDASGVSNPFSFTIAGGADDEEDNNDDDDNKGDNDNEEDKIAPLCGAINGPAAPNPNSGVTLYRMPNDPRVYVIKNKKKHWIKTPKEFEDNCYNWNEIQEISAELLERYPDAEALVSELLRAVGDHKVYKIKEGKRYWIRTAKEFEDGGYNWNEIQDVSPETLSAYQEEITSNLLKAVGDYKVYIIKEGKKRWIKTAEEFNSEGYDWKNIEEVDAQVLNAYSDLVSSSIKIVNASALRVRNSNSIAGDILDVVKRSEVYEVIEKKDGWYKIKTKSGKSGWVSGSYAQEQ